MHLPPSHPLRGSWICKANSKNTACAIPLSPTESLGVTALFYCLISLQENFRFCVSKTGDFITWGNFRKRVQLWFRVIALLYAPSNLGRLITAPTGVICIFKMQWYPGRSGTNIILIFPKTYCRPLKYFVFANTNNKIFFSLSGNLL